MEIPNGYRLERGLLWPEHDTACAAVVFDTIPDMDLALRYVKGWEVAVQAGGNMGVWALALARHFQRVITFEPDPTNFTALSWNTAQETSILALPFALGERSGGWCSTETPPREDNNAGAVRLSQGNTVPVTSIDSLNLQDCDLIYLDIEGYELHAIRGAAETIRAFQPVVAFEDKGLSRHYGVEKGKAEAYLIDLGYRVVARPHRDVIMVPA